MVGSRVRSAAALAGIFFFAGLAGCASAGAGGSARPELGEATSAEESAPAASTFGEAETRASGKRGGRDPVPLPSGSLRLSDVLRIGLSGFTYEEDARQRSFRREARRFLEFRLISPFLRDARARACRRPAGAGAPTALAAAAAVEGSAEDVFCRLMAARANLPDLEEELDTEEEAGERPASHPPRTPGPVVRLLTAAPKPGPAARRAARAKLQRRADWIAGNLKKQNWPALTGAGDAEILAAVKKFRRWSDLVPIAGTLSATAPSCPGAIPASLYFALGLRAEEEFPDAQAKWVGLALYSRGLECADASTRAMSARAKSERGDRALASAPAGTRLPGPPIEVRAAYRYTLLLVAERRCEAAEPLFTRLIADERASDFKSRLLFWRARCAQVLGRKDIEKESMGRLAEEFPLSIHAILGGFGPEGPRGTPFEARALRDEDPGVLFRSRKVASANFGVQAAETLLALDEPRAAGEAIEEILPRLTAAEPEFRLYVSVLLHRAGDTLRNFRALAALFRDHSSMASRATLEMLYPLRGFDIIQSHGGSRVDPYLVLALIRQESAFNADARSHAGARGLMQLLPSTARMFDRGISRRELMDPKTNVRLGARYLAQLLERYQGRADLALAAYNAGPEKIPEWSRRYPLENPLLFLDLIPYKETREYVASIARNYYFYLKLYSREEFEARFRRAGEGVRMPAGVSAGGRRGLTQPFRIFADFERTLLLPPPATAATR